MVHKVLYVATSDIHLATFHLPYLCWLKEQGCIIHIATENRGNILFNKIDNVYYLPFPRSPFKLVYFSTFRKLKEIITKGKYNLIHCHTPLPSVITRLATIRTRKHETKVLYTAHGFHFFKGAPLKNWLFYYTAEYILSAFTDGIVTINQEDFNFINGKMLHKDSYYIKGIGIDSKRFRSYLSEEIIITRKRLGYLPETFILLYVADFIPRKNHQFIIEALPILKQNIPLLKVLFAGKGALLEESKKLARQLKVDDVIDFLGFRDDVPQLAAIADIGISASKQEGLGLGLAEEMLCSVPIVCTINRGHKELIADGINGFLYPHDDEKAFTEKILTLYKNPELRRRMGSLAQNKAQEFVIENSLNSMIDIYRHYLK